MTRAEMNHLIEGVGPDAPTKANARGGRQSDSPYRADLLPGLATLDVTRVLKDGADKYGEDNWRNLSPREIINHAMVHLLAWNAGDRSDDHLSHAACRCLMALELELIEERRERESGFEDDCDDGTTF